MIYQDLCAYIKIWVAQHAVIYLRGLHVSHGDM